MGPSLARMAKRASDMAGVERRIIGVSRFSSTALESQLNAWGVETLHCDLLDRTELSRMPNADNVVYMAGMKFGSSGNEPLTWAINSFLPGLVSEKYAGSRIVAFSTGNVYGLSSVSKGGSREDDALNPVGEYAMSCLGRERIFEHFSRTESDKDGNHSPELRGRTSLRRVAGHRQSRLCRPAGGSFHGLPQRNLASGCLGNESPVAGHRHRPAQCFEHCGSRTTECAPHSGRIRRALPQDCPI